jgi:predicted secreted protein
MPSRAIYVIGVCLIGIFLFAFIWFIFYAAVIPVASGITASMNQYSGTTAYSAFGYAAAFMANLWTYMLAIVIFGLLLWAMVYSQRKGDRLE